MNPELIQPLVSFTTQFPDLSLSVLVRYDLLSFLLFVQSSQNFFLYLVRHNGCLQKIKQVRLIVGENFNNFGHYIAKCIRWPIK